MIGNLLYDKWCDDRATDQAVEYLESVRLTDGTRVTHKRYPFLVGTITRTGETPNPYVIVKWEQHRYSTPELATDLRATPVQP